MNRLSVKDINNLRLSSPSYSNPYLFKTFIDNNLKYQEVKITGSNFKEIFNNHLARKCGLHKLYWLNLPINENVSMTFSAKMMLINEIYIDGDMLIKGYYEYLEDNENDEIEVMASYEFTINCSFKNNLLHGKYFYISNMISEPPIIYINLYCAFFNDGLNKLSYLISFSQVYIFYYSNNGKIIRINKYNVIVNIDLLFEYVKNLEEKERYFNEILRGKYNIYYKIIDVILMSTSNNGRKQVNYSNFKNLTKYMIVYKKEDGDYLINLLFLNKFITVSKDKLRENKDISYYIKNYNFEYSGNLTYLNDFDW